MFSELETSVQFQNPVLTPDEIEELMLLLQPVQYEPVHSGSDDQGLNDQESNDQGSSSSMDEERKRKRMISNRESARRSRWRKKRHLEDLTAESDRLTKENRELKNRVALVANRWNQVTTQNERLRFESVALCATLSDLHRIFRAIHAMSV